MIITGAQIRAARALLKWSAKDLADATGLGLSTVQRMENRGTQTSTTSNVERVYWELKNNGVLFVKSNDANALSASKKRKAIGEGVFLAYPSQDIEHMIQQLDENGFVLDEQGDLLPNNFPDFEILKKLLKRLSSGDVNTNRLYIYKYEATPELGDLSPTRESRMKVLADSKIWNEVKLLNRLRDDDSLPSLDGILIELLSHDYEL